MLQMCYRICIQLCVLLYYYHRQIYISTTIELIIIIDNNIVLHFFLVKTKESQICTTSDYIQTLVNINDINNN